MLRLWSPKMFWLFLFFLWPGFESVAQSTDTNPPETTIPDAIPISPNALNNPLRINVTKLNGHLELASIEINPKEEPEPINTRFTKDERIILEDDNPFAKDEEENLSWDKNSDEVDKYKAQSAGLLNAMDISQYDEEAASYASKDSSDSKDMINDSTTSGGVAYDEGHDEIPGIRDLENDPAYRTWSGSSEDVEGLSTKEMNDQETLFTDSHMENDESLFTLSDPDEETMFTEHADDAYTTEPFDSFQDKLSSDFFSYGTEQHGNTGKSYNGENFYNSTESSIFDRNKTEPLIFKAEDLSTDSDTEDGGTVVKETEKVIDSNEDKVSESSVQTDFKDSDSDMDDSEASTSSRNIGVSSTIYDELDSSEFGSEETNTQLGETMNEVSITDYTTVSTEDYKSKENNGDAEPFLENSSITKSTQYPSNEDDEFVNTSEDDATEIYLHNNLSNLTSSTITESNEENTSLENTDIPSSISDVYNSSELDAEETNSQPDYATVGTEYYESEENIVDISTKNNGRFSENLNSVENTEYPSNKVDELVNTSTSVEETATENFMEITTYENIDESTEDDTDISTESTIFIKTDPSILGVQTSKTNIKSIAEGSDEVFESNDEDVLEFSTQGHSTENDDVSGEVIDDTDEIRTLDSLLTLSTPNNLQTTQFDGNKNEVTTTKHIVINSRIYDIDDISKKGAFSVGSEITENTQISNEDTDKEEDDDILDNSLDETDESYEKSDKNILEDIGTESTMGVTMYRNFDETDAEGNNTGSTEDVLLNETDESYEESDKNILEGIGTESTTGVTLYGNVDETDAEGNTIGSTEDVLLDETDESYEQSNKNILEDIGRENTKEVTMYRNVDETDAEGNNTGSTEDVLLDETDESYEQSDKNILEDIGTESTKKVTMYRNVDEIDAEGNNTGSTEDVLLDETDESYEQSDKNILEDIGTESTIEVTMYRNFDDIDAEGNNTGSTEDVLFDETDESYEQSDKNILEDIGTESTIEVTMYRSFDDIDAEGNNTGSTEDVLFDETDESYEQSDKNILEDIGTESTIEVTMYRNVDEIDTEENNTGSTEDVLLDQTDESYEKSDKNTLEDIGTESTMEVTMYRNVDEIDAEANNTGSTEEVLLDETDESYEQSDKNILEDIGTESTMEVTMYRNVDEIDAEGNNTGSTEDVLLDETDESSEQSDKNILEDIATESTIEVTMYRNFDEIDAEANTDNTGSTEEVLLDDTDESYEQSDKNILEGIGTESTKEVTMYRNVDEIDAEGNNTGSTEDVLLDETDESYEQSDKNILEDIGTESTIEVTMYRNFDEIGAEGNNTRSTEDVLFTTASETESSNEYSLESASQQKDVNNSKEFITEDALISLSGPENSENIEDSENISIELDKDLSSMDIEDDFEKSIEAVDKEYKEKIAFPVMPVDVPDDEVNSSFVKSTVDTEGTTYFNSEKTTGNLEENIELTTYVSASEDIVVGGYLDISLEDSRGNTEYTMTKEEQENLEKETKKSPKEKDEQIVTENIEQSTEEGDKNNFLGTNLRDNDNSVYSPGYSFENEDYSVTEVSDEDTSEVSSAGSTPLDGETVETTIITSTQPEEINEDLSEETTTYTTLQFIINDKIIQDAEASFTETIKNITDYKLLTEDLGKSEEYFTENVKVNKFDQMDNSTDSILSNSEEQDDESEEIPELSSTELEESDEIKVTSYSTETTPFSTDKIDASLLMYIEDDDSSGNPISPSIDGGTSSLSFEVTETEINTNNPSDYSASSDERSNNYSDETSTKLNSTNIPLREDVQSYEDSDSYEADIYETSDGFPLEGNEIHYDVTTDGTRSEYGDLFNLFFVNINKALFGNVDKSDQGNDSLELTTTVRGDTSEEIGGSAQLGEYVPYLQRKIFGRNANFSVKIVVNEKSFYVPSTAHLLQDRKAAIFNISWTSPKEGVNNSLSFSVTRKRIFVTMKLIKVPDGRLHSWKGVFSVTPQMPDTNTYRFEINFGRGVDAYIVTPNVEFLRVPKAKDLDSGDLSSITSEIKGSRLYNVEVAVGTTVLVIGLGMIILLVILKMRERNHRKQNKPRQHVAV